MIFSFKDYTVYTATCDLNGNWAINAVCLPGHPTYIRKPFRLEGPNRSTYARNFPFDTEISIGWKICMTVNIGINHNYLRLLFNIGTNSLVDTIIMDTTQTADENSFYLRDLSRSHIYQGTFGTSLNFRGVNNINMNFTWKAFSQIQLDIGSPYNYSVTTPYYDHSDVLLTDTLDDIEIWSMDMNVTMLDLDCK